ncbi:MAG TPA: hypothetical protein P5234_16010 [Thermoanaerobaculaceae bacterium]|nr:hypothetical protein [Thermoanaerobaculaceae bacterium]HRU10503.1 hypothetical protein [Thermoanaerobaculia bacterium]
MSNAVLIRDHILAAYHGFTGVLARNIQAIGVPMLPGRSKPPVLRAAEIAAASAVVLRLAELATRRALPAGAAVEQAPPAPTSAGRQAAGADAAPPRGRRVVFLFVRVAGIQFIAPARPPRATEPRYIDTTAIEVA